MSEHTPDYANCNYCGTSFDNHLTPHEGHCSSRCQRQYYKERYGIDLDAKDRGENPRVSAGASDRKTHRERKFLVEARARIEERAREEALKRVGTKLFSSKEIDRFVKARIPVEERIHAERMKLEERMYAENMKSIEPEKQKAREKPTKIKQKSNQKKVSIPSILFLIYAVAVVIYAFLN